MAGGEMEKSLSWSLGELALSNLLISDLEQITPPQWGYGIPWELSHSVTRLLSRASEEGRGRGEAASTQFASVLCIQYLSILIIICSNRKRLGEERRLQLWKSIWIWQSPPDCKPLLLCWRTLDLLMWESDVRVDQSLPQSWAVLAG